jgi:hypothetical protein
MILPLLLHPRVSPSALNHSLHLPSSLALVPFLHCFPSLTHGWAIEFQPLDARLGQLGEARCARCHSTWLSHRLFGSDDDPVSGGPTSSGGGIDEMILKNGEASKVGGVADLVARVL